MPCVHETAYPRLKTSMTAKDLTKIYTPTLDEISLANSNARGQSAKRCFLILLKTFQRLGYFIQLRDVPIQIVNHISKCFAGEPSSLDLSAYDESGSRRRHVQIIRDYLQVKPYDRQANQLLRTVIREATLTKEDLADIINVGIEELIRNRFELPGFTTLRVEAQRERAKTHRHIYHSVSRALGKDGRLLIDQILTVNETTGRAPWNAIKEEPGRPTLTHLKELVAHLCWMKTMNVGTEALSSIPHGKIRRFANEAKSLDAGRMQEMNSHKRYTLVVALIKMQTARALDDLGEIDRSFYRAKPRYKLYWTKCGGM